MNFAGQPPSTQWAVLKYRGAAFAEVWFKPDGEPCALTFRIPQQSFQVPGMAQQLTTENLLKAVAIAPKEVESWRHGDVTHSGLNESNPELRSPLPSPPQDTPHLEIHVRLRPASPAAAEESGEVPTSMWQALDTRWKAILGLEATLDTLRISMEGLLAEMEGSLKRSLTTEEKLHAPRADLAEWNKAKSRVHHALPRVREAIHRSVWAMGTPERKQFEEIYKCHIQPKTPFPRMARVLEQLEYLQKDRQILSAHGTTVYHECKGIAANVQNALRTLQSNAAAKKKKNASGGKGKFFKQIRNWSGAD